MGQLFVVGDIHGCVRELDALLNGLPMSGGDAMVFLGDYVDRGAFSNEVVRLLLELRDAGMLQTTFLKGNHEDMFLAYMGFGGHHGTAFPYNGGMDTLASYGMDPLTPGPTVAAKLPSEHLAFFRALEVKRLAPPFLMVHAGIDPARSLADQQDEDMLWIRERFISYTHGLPYTVCFGHTPRREVFVDLPYKIGLDTGCVYGNYLSCIELSEPRLFQVQAGTKCVRTRDLGNAFRAPAIL